MAPPSPTIPIIGVTSSLPITSVSSDGNEVRASDSQEISKHCHIVLTSIQPSDSTSLPSSPPSPGPSNKSTSYPILIVPELAIPAEAQPKWLNQPGGGKEYRCQLCTFPPYRPRLHVNSYQKTLRYYYRLPCLQQRVPKCIASLHKYGKKGT